MSERHYLISYLTGSLIATAGLAALLSQEPPRHQPHVPARQKYTYQEPIVAVMMPPQPRPDADQPTRAIMTAMQNRPDGRREMRLLMELIAAQYGFEYELRNQGAMMTSLFDFLGIPVTERQAYLLGTRISSARYESLSAKEKSRLEKKVQCEHGYARLMARQHTRHSEEVYAAAHARAREAWSRLFVHDQFLMRR
ncbi:hypothetical protein HY492_00370 [Candidatus Woesearchaeota archaeon]|nr:hypothetical protein [Candidatus Woesearchaeota archaeon]